jgi:two-component system chemotaxis response regulator CheY
LAKILVVDDAGFIRRWCTRALEEQGHEVVEATNGKEGVRMFEQMRPDAVLLDVSMPVMDGLTALQQIRVLDPSARVAMLTSEGHMETVVEARRLGARDFVVKPCDSARLLAAIQRILS